MPVCAASLSRIWLIVSLLTKTFTCSHHGQLTPAQESEIIPSVPHHSLLLLQGCLAQVCPHSPQRGSPETPRVCPVPESLPLTPSRARPGHQVDRLLVTLTPARHSHQDGQSLPQPLLPFTHPSRIRSGQHPEELVTDTWSCPRTVHHPPSFSVCLLAWLLVATLLGWASSTKRASEKGVSANALFGRRAQGTPVGSGEVRQQGVKATKSELSGRDRCGKLKGTPLGTLGVQVPQASE